MLRAGRYGSRMKRIIAPLAALLLVALPQAGVKAQDQPAVSQAADPFAELVRVLNSGVDNEMLFERGVGQVRDAMLTSNPDMIAMEREVPGIVDEMITAMLPVLRLHSQETTDLFQRQMTDLLANTLTEQEAREAAAFYGSPLGRRVLGAVEQNYTFSAIAGDVAQGGPDVSISEEAVRRDMDRMTRGAQQDLSAADLAAIERQMAGASWPTRLGALRPRIIELRARAENAPMSPANEREMNRVILEVVERALAERDGASSAERSDK